MTFCYSIGTKRNLIKNYLNLEIPPFAPGISQYLSGMKIANEVNNIDLVCRRNPVVDQPAAEAPLCRKKVIEFFEKYYPPVLLRRSNHRPGLCIG